MNGLSDFGSFSMESKISQLPEALESDAKAFCRSFFNWYNQEHHHAGIGLMTPDQVHYGQTDAIHAARQNTLDGAFNRNPERFVRKQPEPPAKPIATWINPPAVSTPNCNRMA